MSTHYSVCFSQDELGVQKDVQYTQKSHFICTIWVDIGHLWTHKHPLERMVPVGHVMISLCHGAYVSVAQIVAFQLWQSAFEAALSPVVLRD